MTLKASLSNFRPIWANPVVVRDIRVRMRGTKAFWNMGLYLFLLSTISVFGYEQSTNLQGYAFDPVQIQQSLHGFYVFLFEALALLITLIAPALTAVSVISEKKLQTIDLLVTSPMTAMEMLTGKLVSSIAFIALLLVLSIPASALCVILGGATIFDVMQAYALLLIDGILLSSVGLAFSCMAKQYIQAIGGTYGAIFLMLFLFTSAASSLAYGMSGALSTHGALPASMVFIYLIPFVSTQEPGVNFSILGFAVPAWIATGIITALLVRLFLTGAALRLGMYGEGLAGSLKRQILFLTFIGAAIIGQSFAQIGTRNVSDYAFLGICSAGFAVSLFFLPALFVPAKDEDGPIGQKVKGWYDIRKAFKPVHSGALPYFHIWLICLAAGVLVSFYLPGITPTSITGQVMQLGPNGRSLTTSSNTDPTVVSAALPIVFYISGLGFLFWSIARRASWVAPNVGVAKALTFLTFLLIMLAPYGFMIIASQTSNEANVDPYSLGSAHWFWLLNPYTTFPPSGTILKWDSFITCGRYSYFLGILVYPFWLDVVPGKCAELVQKRQTRNQLA